MCFDSLWCFVYMPFNLLFYIYFNDYNVVSLQRGKESMYFAESVHLNTSIPLSYCHRHICAFLCAYWCPLLPQLSDFNQDQKQPSSLSKQFFPTVSNPLAALPTKNSVCPPFHKIPSGALYFFKELDEIFKLMDSLQEFHSDLGLPTCIFYTQGGN